MAHPIATARTDLNVRSAPDPDDPTTVLPPPLKSGDGFTVLRNQGHWLVIQDDQRQRTGFVNGTHTACHADGSSTLWQTTVTASGLNIRSAPTPQADIRHVVSSGTRLDVIGYEVVLREDTQKPDLWLQVRFKNHHGYVASKYTTGTPRESRSELSRLMAKERLSAAEVQLVRALIADVEDTKMRGDLYEALQTKTVYRSQRNNEARDARGNKIETRSGNMCNLTSLAMCLDYLGIANPQPDRQFEDVLEHIRAKHNFGPRTTAGGWSRVARHFGVQTTFIAPTAITAGKSWYMTHVRTALRAGYAVMLSITGHIVRVVRITDAGVLVWDPAGFSEVKPGTKYRFVRSNAYGVMGQTVGKDVLWPWRDVERHSMLWIAKFRQPDSLGERGVEDEAPLPGADDEPSEIALPPLPEVDVADEEVSHIDELTEQQDAAPIDEHSE